MRTTAAIATIVGLTALGGCSDTSSEPPRRSVTESPSAAPATADFNTAGLLGGNARPRFPAGEAGRLSVVETSPVSPSNQSVIALAVRNDTDGPVTAINVTVRASTTGGTQATGTSKGTSPTVLQPGEAGLVAVYFPADGGQPDPDLDTSTLDYRLTSEPATAGSTSSLQVEALSTASASLAGTVRNQLDQGVTGPFAVDVYCFSAADRLTYATHSFTQQAGVLAPGGTTSFQVGLVGVSCPRYLVGASFAGQGG
jgi:hypothetical protein